MLGDREAGQRKEKSDWHYATGVFQSHIKLGKFWDAHKHNL